MRKCHGGLLSITDRIVDTLAFVAPDRRGRVGTLCRYPARFGGDCGDDHSSAGDLRHGPPQRLCLANRHGGRHPDVGYLPIGHDGDSRILGLPGHHYGRLSPGAQRRSRPRPGIGLHGLLDRRLDRRCRPDSHHSHRPAAGTGVRFTGAVYAGRPGNVHGGGAFGKPTYKGHHRCRHWSHAGGHRGCPGSH